MDRYELVEGTSSKFWEISLDGTSFTTHWGRIGTAGQSTTKTFPSPEAAKKEHDKLVAEKVKKGYQRSGEAPPAADAKAKPSPPKKKPAGKAAAGGFRADLSVYNEATAFVIAGSSVVGRGFDSRSDDWARAVTLGDLLGVELVQDDSFIIRVVVGDLDPAEEDEWVGRIAWKLRIPDGKLFVAGGIELVTEPREGGLDYLRSLDALREVEVPPGEYQAEVFSYLTGVNGNYLLERSGGEAEKIGTYFRRTRKGKKPPEWLASRLRSDPGDDPGHEKEWARAKYKELEGSWIDFLLRLSPLDGARAPTGKPKLEHGMFSLSAIEARRPELCPLGIVAKDPIKNPPVPVAPPKVVPVDVFSRVRDRALVAVKGGPVEHPIAKLFQAYRLPWLATDGADPEIRVQLPPGASFAPEGGEKIEHVAVTPLEGEGHLRFGIEASGGSRWAQPYAVEKISARLASLPDGSTVELLTARAPDPKQHEDLGVGRFRGEVRGGTWKISETFPALDAALLRQALELSAAVDDGTSIRLSGAEEEAKVLELAKNERLLRRNPAVVKDGAIGLTQKDSGLMNWVAGFVFRTRWSSVWPHWVEPEEDRKAREEARARFAKMGEGLAKKIEQAAAPKLARELVLEGKSGKLEKIDLKKERPSEVEFVDNCDRQMRELGFEPLGDLAHSRFPGVFVRAYAKKNGDTWAEFLTTPVEGTFDFFTHWEKAGFTSTLKDGPTADDPAKGIYISRHPKLNFYLLEDLHGRHEKRLKKLAKELGTPFPTEATLPAFAKALDRGLARQLGIS